MEDDEKNKKDLTFRNQWSIDSHWILFVVVTFHKRHLIRFQTFNLSHERSLDYKFIQGKKHCYLKILFQTSSQFVQIPLYWVDVTNRESNGRKKNWIIKEIFTVNIIFQKFLSLYTPIFVKKSTHQQVKVHISGAK